MSEPQFDQHPAPRQVDDLAPAPREHAGHGRRDRSVFGLLAVAVLSVLVGCWQSSAREPIRTEVAPPPRVDAMNGGEVVPDAGVVNVSVPDAGAAPSSWQVLRNQPQPQPASRVAARVVHQYIKDGVTYVTLDRGSMHAVGLGWKARFHDRVGNRRFDVVEVIQVARDVCTITTLADPDQVGASGRVMLWNPRVTGEP